MIDLTRTRACKKYNSTLPNMSLPCRRVIPTNHLYNLCCLDHWGAVSQDIRTWQSTHSVRIYRPVWPVVEHSLLYTSWEVAYIAQVTSGWLIAVNHHSVCTSPAWLTTVTPTRFLSVMLQEKTKGARPSLADCIPPSDLTSFYHLRGSQSLRCSTLDS